MDHYELLGVARTASRDQVNAAARAALWQGKVDGEDARRLMRAWFILGDDGRRRDYDAGLTVTGPGPLTATPGTATTWSAPGPGKRRAEPAEAEAPNAPPIRSEPRSVSGPRPAERIARVGQQRPDAARNGTAPQDTKGRQGADDAASRAAQDREPGRPDFDPTALSWMATPLPLVERIGPGYNGIRVVVVLGLLCVALGAVFGFISAVAAAAAGGGAGPVGNAVVLFVGAMLALKAVGNHWPRAVGRAAARQQVFGVGGAVLGTGYVPFAKESVDKGVEGEQRTARALEALLRIPGTRIFHGLRFPGSRVADVDHAVVNGDRVVFIDSKNWKPGEYRWIAADKLAERRSRGARTVHMDHLQQHPATRRAAREIACHVLVHANAPGSVTFTPGAGVSPTGIPATNAQDGIEMIGRWLIEGSKAGLVDRYVLGRLLAMRK